MKIIYCIIGSLGLVLTIVALILPIVPATPFLIVALFGFSRASRRIHRMLVSLPLIRPLYETLQRQGSFTPRQRAILIALTIPVAIVPFLITRNFSLRLTGVLTSLLGLLVVCFYRHRVSTSKHAH